MTPVFPDKPFQVHRGGAICAIAVTLMMYVANVQAAGDRALGEYLSSECVTCHQLTGQYQGIPPIIGWPEASFIEIMNEYRRKKRNNAIMQTVAGRFSDEEVAALAAYFGSLKDRPRDEKTTHQQQQRRGR
jgi:cytochrome c553